MADDDASLDKMLGMIDNGAPEVEELAPTTDPIEKATLVLVDEDDEDDH